MVGEIIVYYINDKYSVQINLFKVKAKIFESIKVLMLNQNMFHNFLKMFSLVPD